MLIGNNTNFNNDNNNFNNKMRTIKENNNITNNTINNDTNMYKNITNANETVDKSFQILKDRLDNGLITLDEFNKKCQQINKSRNN